MTRPASGCPEEFSEHVRRAFAGDLHAFEWLVQSVTPFLLLLARSRLDREALLGVDEGDVVQDVWMSAMLRFRTAQGEADDAGASFMRFLGRLTVFTVQAWQRRQIARTSSQALRDVGALAAPARGDAWRLDAAVLAHRARCGLAALGPDQREAFLLRGLERLDNEEAARIAGKRPNTMAKNFQRARESLRRRGVD